MPFPTTTPNKNPGKVWTNADLKPYPNLEIQVESGEDTQRGVSRSRPLSEDSDWLRGADINGGASIDEVLAAAREADSRMGLELDGIRSVAGAMGRDRNSSIKPISKAEALYWQAKDAIDPQLRQMVQTLGPAAMAAGGPLGAGAGALVSADSAFSALQPNISAGERGLHGLFAALGIPGVAKGAAYAMGKPTAKEAALAAERAATGEAVAGARELKSQGFSHSAAGKIAGTPGRGKSKAVEVNRNPKGEDGFPRAAKPTNTDVSKRVAQGKSAKRAQEHINDVWGAGDDGIQIRQDAPPTPVESKAGASVPVHKDLKFLPESVYERDLGLLGGRQGASELRGADRRVVDVPDAAYEAARKNYSSQARGTTTVPPSANNAAALAEIEAGAYGGNKPIGTPRMDSMPRRGGPVRQEFAPKAETRPSRKGSEQRSSEETFIESLLNGIRRAVGKG